MTKLTTAQKRAMQQIERDKIVYRDQGIRWDVAQRLYLLGLVEFDQWDEGDPSFHARFAWRVGVKGIEFGERPKSRWER